MNNAVKNKPSYVELETENLRLRRELDLLRRLIFGQKRERFVPASSPEQLQINLDVVVPETLPAKTEQITYTRQQKPKPKPAPHSRNPLPENLPRKIITILPEQDVTDWKKIGEEITEELEYEPGKLFVNRYVRPKYVNPAAEASDASLAEKISSAKDESSEKQTSSLPVVVIGQLPSRPIDRGIAGPGLIVHILISKFCDHLPWYRQNTQFKRLGVDLAISTMCDWHKAACGLLEPLYQKLFALVISSGYLMVDETPIKVLDRDEKGKAHLGYMWVYYDPLGRRVFFDYQPDRSQLGPRERLKTFKGYIQNDGYAGYNEVHRRLDITALACMAHVRRKFFEAQANDPVRAKEMLQKIQRLYDIERQAREAEMSFEERFRLRHQNARPVMAEIKSWLDENIKHITPKSAIGQAMAYTLNLWSRLERYLEDGRLEIDNNLVENQIRPVALGRKNYLFAGSHDGARRAAMIYSLVGTAKQQKVEPFAYLRDILDRIADHPYHQLDELLPPKWTPLVK